ncbi:hypothetical protein NBH00_04130 [Paraconexibacter antarcticus]|uniref:SnoaL-like domain-containing protein n=1 Tax=Paraconexibacter antarcticus TaxID=2949664 RepID=A0ABY5DTQ2_9ACTN|nr:hypothetical protein [Paraconexibacter antarcticus]UTI65405.1 hypothetical protein NBH00_04130 [Paraconexibacter antarcticus]
MNYAFAVKWLRGFRTSPEDVCALYADDFLFEDWMLDQTITDMEDLHRVFAPYANTDPDNGIGIHNFRIRGYEGDERSGLIRWEWGPDHAAVFLGLDVANKPFWTQGHTFHVYNEEGKIVKESSWWDASAVLRGIGMTAEKSVFPVQSAVGAA